MVTWADQKFRAQAGYKLAYAQPIVDWFNIIKNLHLTFTVVWARFVVISTRPASVDEDLAGVDNILGFCLAMLNCYGVAVEGRSALQLVMPGKVVPLDVVGSGQLFTCLI